MRSRGEIEAEIAELEKEREKLNRYLVALRKALRFIEQERTAIYKEADKPEKIYDMSSSGKWRGNLEDKAVRSQKAIKTATGESLEQVSQLLKEIKEAIKKILERLDEIEKRIAHLEEELNSLPEDEDNGEESA